MRKDLYDKLVKLLASPLQGDVIIGCQVMDTQLSKEEITEFLGKTWITGGSLADHQPYFYRSYEENKSPTRHNSILLLFDEFEVLMSTNIIITMWHYYSESHYGGYKTIKTLDFREDK